MEDEDDEDGVMITGRAAAEYDGDSGNASLASNGHVAEATTTGVEDSRLLGQIGSSLVGW